MGNCFVFPEMLILTTEPSGIIRMTNVPPTLLAKINLGLTTFVTSAKKFMFLAALVCSPVYLFVRKITQKVIIK